MKKSQLKKKAEELINLRAVRKANEAKLAPLASELKQYVMENGEDEENSVVVYVNTDAGEIELRNVRKQSTKLKTSAIDYIKANLPRRIQHRLIETVEIVRMDILEKLIEEDKLTARQIKGIVTVETSEAFTPKVIEE
jgi:heterodisulfide reductase subunit C